MAQHVLYVVHRELLNPVFDAMVLRQLGGLAERGHRVRLVVSVDLPHLVLPRWRRIVRDTLRRVTERTASRPVVVPVPPKRWRNLFGEFTLLKRRLAREMAREAGGVVHCRNAPATYAAVTAKRDPARWPVLWDVRGVESLEAAWGSSEPGRSQAELERHPLPLVQHLARLERVAAEGASGWLCVSAAMRDYLVERFGLGEASTAVIWNSVPVKSLETNATAAMERDRHKMRCSLGFDDELVLVYSGSVYPRQCVDMGLRVVRWVMEAYPRSRFLGLSQNLEQLRGLVADAGIDEGRCVLRTVPHEDVPGYLRAADIGLISTNLFHPPALANRICCPVKYAEYLAAGLPVILSDGIGDFSALTTETGLGCVLGAGEDATEVRRKVLRFLEPFCVAREAYRERCKRLAAAKLSYDRAMDALQDLYRAAEHPAVSGASVSS